MKRAMIFLLLLAACRERAPGYAVIGDASRGRALAVHYGCVSCHAIPGIGSATGSVGPPLDRMAVRQYLAGRYPNVPQWMVQWIRFPLELKPGTAMPDLGVSERDARDIAAYLYTLR